MKLDVGGLDFDVSNLLIGYNIGKWVLPQVL